MVSYSGHCFDTCYTVTDKLFPNSICTFSELTKYVVLESQGLSRHSQEPATGPYPEPIESTPHTHPTNTLSEFTVNANAYKK
jgi:hypothetical protein